MNKPKNKKNTILKQSISKTADIGISLVLNSIPTGNAVYELAKLGVEQTKKYLTERKEKRIECFHRTLLNPSSDTDHPEESLLEIPDYHVLLNACLQDLEDEKTELYATLARNVSTQKLSSKDLRFFCISLSEMVFADLEEMRIAYIASEFNLIPSAGAGNFKKSLSPEQAESEQIYGRKLMELRGFSEKGEISKYGKCFIQSCYPTEKLTPKSINMPEWKNSNSPILMLSYEISDPYIAKLYNLLSEQLRECGFQTSGLEAPQSRRISFSLITISIVIFKEHPERVINNINNIDHLMGEYSIAVQGCKNYPTILDPLRDRFKKIINISNNDLQTAITTIINSIKES